jgi:hypothetical protein
VSEPHAELDVALQRVISAAHVHLAALKAASGRTGDEQVWQAYVALNNASYAYDEELLQAFGEVTPWDVELIDVDRADGELAALPDAQVDPHPRILSIRHRRDYRVPSVSALFRLADSARLATTPVIGGASIEPVESVGEAVLELIEAGDGALSALDVPELESLGGTVVVAEVTAGINPDGLDEVDGADAFALQDGDRVIDRLDEYPYDLEGDPADLFGVEDLQDGEQVFAGPGQTPSLTSGSQALASE